MILPEVVESKKLLEPKLKGTYRESKLNRPQK